MAIPQRSAWCTCSALSLLLCKLLTCIWGGGGGGGAALLTWLREASRCSGKFCCVTLDDDATLFVEFLLFSENRCTIDTAQYATMGLQQSKEPSGEQMPPCSAGQEAFRANNATQSSNCPVPEDVRRPVYNVYNQRIDGSGGASSSAPATEGSPMLDPKNNMPLVPNQQPFPGQRKLLSTARVDSTIPKGGTESTWTYPSPQMFYNGTAFIQCRVPHTHDVGLLAQHHSLLSRLLTAACTTGELQYASVTGPWWHVACGPLCPAPHICLQSMCFFCFFTNSLPCSTHAKGQGG